MYIPALFSTAANGCPDGYNAYNLANYSITNVNSGLRGRIVTNWNEYTNTVVGENYQGDGNWDNAILNNGGGVGINALQRPIPLSAADFPNFGTSGQDIVNNGYITGSNGDEIIYCYDCSKKYRWTFGSFAGLPAPWPSLASPLNVRLLTNSTGNINSSAAYTTFTLNFANGTTGSIEGFGPVWQNDANNAPHYYIISRDDITPIYYTIQNCATLATASISLAGSYSLAAGTVFKASGAGITGSCWSVSGSFQSATHTPTYSNVVTSSTFVDCNTCVGKYNVVDCQTSASYVVTFANPNVNTGSIISSYFTSTINCYTIASTASAAASLDYSNVITSSTYNNCATCVAALPTSSFVSGAVVIYDFGNTSSYPGSGSTVYDLSGYNRTGSLINGPVWSSTNGGQLSLDSGSQQYILFNTAFSASFTTMAVIKAKSTTWTNYNNGYSGFPFAGNINNGVIITNEVSSTKDVIAIVYAGGTPSVTNTVTPASIDTWRTYTFTTNGTNSHILYVDSNVSSSSSTSLARANSATGSAFIGYDPNQAANRGYLNGYVMGYLQYNRKLTQAEIESNIAIFSTRF